MTAELLRRLGLDIPVWAQQLRPNISGPADTPANQAKVRHHLRRR